MTQHVTISLDDEELRSARALADSLGLTLEDFVRDVVRGHLSLPTRDAPAKPDISILFGFCESDEPTDIWREKDKLVGEAVWKEHLRKTGQS